MAKVLVVAERYWPEGGGGELATHLIIGMLKEHFDVTVVTGSTEIERHEGVEYIYEPLLSRREKIFLWPNVERLARKGRFMRLLRDADVVYVPRFAFPVVPHAKKLGKKVAVHLHGYIPISYTAVVLAPYEEHKGRITRDDISLECSRGLKHCVAASAFWWLPKLARKWISQADKIICVSRRQAEIMKAFMPEISDRIEVVYNPLPPEILSKGIEKDLYDTPTFLYSGGDSYVKGFHTLLHAIKLLDKRSKSRFILTNKYGDRALKEINNLKQKLRHVSIEIIGKISFNQHTELYKYAWASIFPSISEETFGYVVAEAMAMKTMPIASRVGGVLEIVEGTLAERFLLRPGNAEDLVNKIEILTSLSKKELLDVGENLRKSVLKKFDNTIIKNNLIKALRKYFE